MASEEREREESGIISESSLEMQVVDMVVH